jgi:putative membrane protein
VQLLVHLPAHGPRGDHHVDGTAVSLLGWLPLVLLAAAGLGYVALSLRLRTAQRWPPHRTALFLLGLALLGVALLPAFDAFADRDFAGHAAQHLLLAMLAPLALVLGTPVTLLLRALPHPMARRLGAVLNSAPVHLLTRPVVALALSSGGLVALYFTPLYQLSTEHDAVHLAVHAHLVLSGVLFAWVVVGLDPTPHRARVRTRLVILGISIAVHASVSQLLYAGLLVQVREPVVEMQAAGSLMYFGGDIAELLLAAAMLATARRDRARRDPARHDPARRDRTRRREPALPRRGAPAAQARVRSR